MTKALTCMKVMVVALGMLAFAGAFALGYTLYVMMVSIVKLTSWAYGLVQR